jgi:hypothetical protein
MNHGDQCRNLTLTPQAWRVLPLLDLDVQLDAERRRQRGWRLVCASSGNPPEALPPGGELVFGPPGAHTGGGDF